MKTSGMRMSDDFELVQFLMGPEVSSDKTSEYLVQLQNAPLETIQALLQSLLHNTPAMVDQHPTIVDGLLRLVQANLLNQPRDQQSSIDPDLFVAVYEQLPPTVSTRYLLLHGLAIARGDEHLQLLVQQLIDDAPASWVQTGLILSPLFQHDDWNVDAVFPALQDAIANTTVASSVLDLANRLFRVQRVQTHPFVNRQDELITLLGALTRQLEQGEQNPQQLGETVDQINEVLSQSIALIVSVCDALALMDAQRAIPGLSAAMDLSHRRIQTEAAGALCRLQQPTGTQRLVALAAEPTARLRVLAYADELGIADQIDPVYRSPVARAESDLALWLAQPGQMGVPPSRMELVDQRHMYWPGYEQPLDCYLFRFEYEFRDQSFRNTGIAGPMIHSMAADLNALSIDDTYAIFAGWHAEHDDIYFVINSQWNVGQRQAVDHLTKELTLQGFELIAPRFMGFFLGEYAVAGQAVRDQSPGSFVYDGAELLWFPSTGGSRALDPQDVWHIYIGRKMLRTFNP